MQTKARVNKKTPITKFRSSGSGSGNGNPLYCISENVYKSFETISKSVFFFVISSLNVIDNVAANPYEIFWIEKIAQVDLLNYYILLILLARINAIWLKIEIQKGFNQ